MKLRFDHYLIRDYVISDANQLSKMLGDPLLMKYMEKTYTHEETVTFLKDSLNRNPSPVYALEDCDTSLLAGHLIFHPYDHESYEIGWIIARDFQGNHLAEKTTEELIRFGISEGIRKYVIECVSLNTQSAYIAEKTGFHPAHDENGMIIFTKCI